LAQIDVYIPETAIPLEMFQILELDISPERQRGQPPLKEALKYMQLLEAFNGCRTRKIQSKRFGVAV
jgi:hypothetical protein